MTKPVQFLTIYTIEIVIFTNAEKLFQTCAPYIHYAIIFREYSQ